MNNQNQYCVIMAGGIGSRFWPMSTTKFPKQFQDILGTGRTMIQQTYDRISKIIPNENIFVITNKEYVNLCQEQLTNIPKENIVGEPMMKNTAVCNIYMANKLFALNSEAKMVILPADHLILKEDNFIEKIELAFSIVKKNDYLITLGITPTRSDTGYGYIQYSSNSEDKIFKVKTFTEKPNLELAKAFLESGDFLWNAGIFIWSAKSIISAFEKFLPNMIQEFQSCDYNSQTEANCIEAIYPNVEKISVDNGIIEKAKNVYVIPADLGWSDLGTWTSVYQNGEKDKSENAINNKNVLTYNCERSIVRVKDKDKLVVIDGLKDFIVVDTDKSLLICPIENDQRIKDYVMDLKNLKKGEDYI